MKLRFVVIIPAFVFAIGAFGQNQNPDVKTTFPSSEAHKNSKLTYKLISSQHNTFGYDIFSNGKILIHQPTIPGVAGNDGFHSKPAAERVAALVVDKISKGIMPPVVSIEEMKKLKAIP